MKVVIGRSNAALTVSPELQKKLVIGKSNAALTVSIEFQKMLLLYQIALLLELPKKDRLLFLAGLSQLFLSLVAKIASEVRRVDNPIVSPITETVCQPIVKTGPPNRLERIN